MRHWLCAAALCALAAPAAADAPLPNAAAQSHARPPALGVPPLALAEVPAVTPVREGAAVAPLPRGNPGDPLARESRERGGAEARDPAATEARDADTEAKGGAAVAGSPRAREGEAK